MVFHNFTITLPLGGTEAAPETTIGYIGKGVIHRLVIFFPRGCFGLAHIQIFVGGVQVWPSIQGQTFAYDGYTLDVLEHFEIEAGPTEVRIVGWNEDETYNHTIQVGFGILPKSVLLPTGSTEGIIRSLSSLFLRPRTLEREGSLQGG